MFEINQEAAYQSCMLLTRSKSSGETRIKKMKEDICEELKGTVKTLFGLLRMARRCSKDVYLQSGLDE